MKKAFFLLSLIALTYQCNAQNVDNDVKRYGLKGKVKMMEEARFPYTRQVNGDWIVVDTVFYNVEKYNFDESGRLSAIEHLHYQVAGRKGVTSTITKFSYKDDKIAGSKTYDDHGREIGASTVNWVNNNTYIDSFSEKESKNEIVHVLDKDMRNKVTTTKKYNSNGQLMACIITNFSYDKNGRANKEVITDSLSKNNYHFEFKPLGADKKGNRSKVLFTDNKKAGMPKQLLLYTYEYYK
ncbi:MAG: hypothetical protein JSS96_00025 [Bacteroidetes bacterium]|nr:hypothetical protein [Bacteroidota bacterium]